MAWNPGTYNKFKSERFTPFYDLLDLVVIRPGLEVLDLGCGTGELTRKLADALPESKILGIDSSEEMLNESNLFANDQLLFAHRSIEEQLRLSQKWDLIFSNAALQWVGNHEILFPDLIEALKPGGQLLIQMPDQQQNISNIMLNTLADEEPFKTALKDWKRESPVLDINDYARILFENGSRTMHVYEKIYPLVLDDSKALFDWVSGTALLPFIEKLQDKIRQEFVDRYQIKLKEQFSTTPVFYPFKRILISAEF